ncbi:MAG: sigma-70 family RNA polymerase sigma factor [Alphaproteobacteria bacterium]|nr:sigma-70 family RNA polymerase sigma factor [Alphaproteobacteria bacterium]
MQRPEPRQAADGARELDDLVQRVGRNRDREAFVRLYRHFAPRVKAYLLRLGADDGAAEETTQETMLSLWRRAESFDPTQAGAGTWVFTIARNRRIDLIRRERRPEPDNGQIELMADPAEPVDQTIAAGQRDSRVRAALETLPQAQAALIQMAYYEDLTQTAIADRTGLPLGTVKSRFRLAFARLKRALEGDPS